MVTAEAPAGELERVRRATRWTGRDWVAAIALFAATAAVILWQNAHVAVLWDLSYVLDTANRIALGQMPYRDFPLAHAPLTFLIQAAIIRLGGSVYWHHILYVSAIGGLSSVVAWRTALAVLRERVERAWAVSLLLAAPLAVVGVYCILPHPSYDCDCAFWMLVSLWSLVSMNRGSVSRGFAAGVLACVPVFFKQNMGLPLLAAVVGAVAVLLVVTSIRRTEGSPDARGLWALLAGAASSLAAAALVLHLTAGLDNYLHWTIGFAAQRRLPGLKDMLGVYLDPGLLWTLPCIAIGALLLRIAKPAALWARIAAFAWLAAPFAWTLCSLALYDDADERGDALLALWPMLLIVAAAAALWNIYRQRDALSLRTLLPLVILAAINGTLMSQQLWGSTYAIWPLLVLLLAELVAALAGFAPRDWLVPALAAFIATTLLVCGGLYTGSEDRLSYAQFPAAAVEHSANARLAGLSTQGAYLPNFDELLRYAAANIPPADGIVLLPGEDPFYYASGRLPRFPVLLFDPATDPYSPAEVAALVHARNIRWLIVKRDLQLTSDPTPERALLLLSLQQEFTLAARLNGYDVYRR